MNREDRFFAEPDVQRVTRKSNARNRSNQKNNNHDDDTFSGDLLGCFAVFDGGGGAVHESWESPRL